MTISQTQLDQVLSEAEIKKFWLGYFQEEFRQEIHQKLLDLFEDQKSKKGLTRSQLAQKIGRRPEQVTRWLAAPSNFESDTISDMFLAMGVVPRLSYETTDSLFTTGRPNHVSKVSSFVDSSRTNRTQINDAKAKVHVPAQHKNLYKPFVTSDGVANGR